MRVRTIRHRWQSVPTGRGPGRMKIALPGRRKSSQGKRHWRFISVTTAHTIFTILCGANFSAGTWWRESGFLWAENQKILFILQKLF